MLQALDKTLKELLEREFPKNIFGNTSDKLTVSFKTPYGGKIPKPAINLFLYDVQENLDLRNQNWSVERINNSSKAVKKRLPARVDCSYLISVWIGDDEDKDEDNSELEHEILGEVMKVLLRYPKIPKAYISADLPEQELPLRLVSLRSSSLQSFGEFWQAMGGKEGAKPKVLLHCTVTISVPVDEAGEEVGLVGVYKPSSQ